MMSKNERIIFERILFPTDLSTETNYGLEYAVALARSYGAKLFLCHCMRPQATPGALEKAKRILGEMMENHLQSDTATPFEWQVIVVEGETAMAVARVAAEQHIDLIVMHSRKISRAPLLDSTAEAISRTAPCPALITSKPGQEPVEARIREIDFKRILVAYDFSGDSELALTHGLSLAQEFQSELHLMHVLTTTPKANSSAATITLVNPENAFQMAAKRLWNAVPTETHLWSEVKQVVSQGSPYREILAYARENDIDLICIGASGAGFGQWALFGSNTTRILRQASCPVLIARPLRPIAQEASFTVNSRVAS
jgi:nucleotide-binding universal stress UspA family protein